MSTAAIFTTHDQIDIKATAMSARMSGLYQPTETGHHYLSLSGAGVTKLTVDGNPVVSQDSAIVDAMAFIAGSQDEARAQYYFEAGKTYKVEVVTVMPDVTIPDSHILDKQLCAHVGFVPQAQMERKLQEESIALARDANVALVFVGNTYQWESEGQDMGSMVLPPYDTRTQDALVSAVAAANPNTLAVVNTDVPVKLPWIDEVAGLVQGWYAGQEFGNALVDVLVGDINPSGKLPVSWPRAYEHAACYGNFGQDSQESKEVEYVEGVFVGYRHFDRYWQTDMEVRFPFGYGLSYTQFEIRDFSVSGAFSKDPGSQVTITAKVKNVGQRSGAEVLQAYIAPPSGIGRPSKELGGFFKVVLQPTQEDAVEIAVSKDAAAFWDDDLKKWRVVAGSYGVLLATSSSPEDVVGRMKVDVDEEFAWDP